MPKLVLDEVVKEELTTILNTVRFRINADLRCRKKIAKAAKYGHHCCVNLYKNYYREYEQSGEGVKRAKAYFVPLWRAFNRIVVANDIACVHVHWMTLKQDVE